MFHATGNTGRAFHPESVLKRGRSAAHVLQLNLTCDLLDTFQLMWQQNLGQGIVLF